MSCILYGYFPLPLLKLQDGVFVINITKIYLNPLWLKFYSLNFKSIIDFSDSGASYGILFIYFMIELVISRCLEVGLIRMHSYEICCHYH